MLTCDKLSHISGWQCSQAPDDSLFVSTPVTLLDGTPLGFFLSIDNGIATFSDEGITIFALRNQHFDLDDRRNWKGIERIASNLGFTLLEDGELTMSFPEAESPYWFGRITRLVGDIAAWEQERIAQSDTRFTLTREVEDLLRRIEPGRELTLSPRVTIDGKSMDFDFLWGDTYVDAIAPKARSTSARLRKAIMARPLELQGGHIMIIVDDREDPKKSKDEIDVLSQVCKAIGFNELAQRSMLH